jgi:hypothetical protein
LGVLAGQQLNPEDIKGHRDRLILVMRLLALHRGIDLARSLRTISVLQSKAFILVQRKGWVVPKWEQIINLPHSPNISPWHLLQKYVHLTATLGTPGGPLLLALNPPYKPLSANSINSLTKQLLLQYGIPMSVFGAHSTRGAGVAFYKKMGLSSEAVCELGQWKNVQAFSSHYLRLNAADTVSEKFSLSPRVHTVSPVDSVDSEGSCTPRQHNLGGSDPEEYTQNTGEPTSPSPVAQANFPRHTFAKRKASSSPKRAKNTSPWNPKAPLRDPPTFPIC